MKIRDKTTRSRDSSMKFFLQDRNDTEITRVTSSVRSLNRVTCGDVDRREEGKLQRAESRSPCRRGSDEWIVGTGGIFLERSNQTTAFLSPGVYLRDIIDDGGR
jgi:hypothetical protein